jgi:hypothetical protein
LEVNAENDPELFSMAKVGLGCLGVVTEVTLKVRDAAADAFAAAAAGEQRPPRPAVAARCRHSIDRDPHNALIAPALTCNANRRQYPCRSSAKRLLLHPLRKSPATTRPGCVTTSTCATCGCLTPPALWWCKLTLRGRRLNPHSPSTRGSARVMACSRRGERPRRVLMGMWCRRTVSVTGAG